MRFEVPQFIEIEDKIFGPLSWRQFLYVGGGIGMAVVIFITLPFIVFILTGLPLALLAGALAFYPINNRPFSFFLEAIFSYLSHQRFYLWRQKNSVVHKTPPKDSHSRMGARSNPIKNKDSNISSLARRLELQALQKSE
jgi:hypothetical protein